MPNNTNNINTTTNNIKDHINTFLTNNNINIPKPESAKNILIQKAANKLKTFTDDPLQHTANFIKDPEHKDVLKGAALAGVGYLAYKKLKERRLNRGY